MPNCVTKYNTTYEFSADNYLVTYTPPVAKTLESITLSGTYQTTFEQNEEFSYDGLIVTAHYDDESSKEVTPTEVSTPDMSALGNPTVTVSYTEGGVTKTATYPINVHEMDERYEVSFLPGDGEGSMDSVQVRIGYDYTLPTTCTFTPPAGQVFDHWELDGVTITIIEEIDDNVEVTAIYVDAPATSTLSAVFGGETSSSNTEITDGDKYKTDYNYSIDSNLSFSNISKVYPSDGKAPKFGSSSAVGTMTVKVDIDNAIIVSVTVNALKYKADKATTMTIGGVEKELTNEAADYVADVSSAESDSVVISALSTSADKRFYVVSITIEYSTSGVTPSEKVLTGISVSDPKTAYYVGDEFVKPTVTATYDSGSPKVVTESADFSGFDSSAAVESQTITVSYTEGGVTKTTTYDVSISEPAPVVTATYRKVTSELADYSGDYLIVYEDGNVAFDGSLETLDAASNTQAVTIAEDGTIQLSEAYEFHIASKEGGYSIQSSSGLYIGKTANSNGLDSNATVEYVNTISYVGGETSDMDVVGSGGAYLRYNADSGQERFRFFKSSTYTGQKAIALYRKVTVESVEALILSETNGYCSSYQETDPSSEIKALYEAKWT